MIDRRNRQAFGDAVGEESLSVEAAEPEPRGEPDEATRISNDAPDVGMREAVGCRVLRRREPLGVKVRE